MNKSKKIIIAEPSEIINEKFKNILNKIKYIELSGRVDFQKFYIDDLGKV